jgi:2'-5' RNA ligase
MSEFARADMDRFSNLKEFSNHWERRGWWPGRRGYYWYLTFADETALQDLANKCQEVMRSPQFDLTPLSDLHLTLGRISFDDTITFQELAIIEAAARSACSRISSFRLDVGPLTGSETALRLSVSPWGPINSLRFTLDAITASILPREEEVSPEPFLPHIGIAYCNSRILAPPIVSRTQVTHSFPDVQVSISNLALVLLERGEQSYDWTILATVSLSPESSC